MTPDPKCRASQRRFGYPLGEFKLAVTQLPKSAAVEVDMIAVAHD